MSQICHSSKNKYNLRKSFAKTCKNTHNGFTLMKYGLEPITVFYAIILKCPNSVYLYL